METCQLSQLLFQYLSRIFGSEKTVRVRRLYYGIEDCCNVSFPWRPVYSGSKAEGLDMPGSDLDIMYIYLKKAVYPDVRSCPQDDFPSLFISTDDSAPGFVHIHFRINPCRYSCGRTPTITIGERAIDGVHTDTGIILQNSIFKDLFTIMFNDSILENLHRFFLRTHGPCQSTIDGSIDRMFSFRLHSWPNVASGWIWRSRLSDWPPSSTISNIVHENVLLVPIGSKFGSLEDNPNEWRISFSLAEKLLVHSFNHTQLMCYVLLKILLNEILNKNMGTKDLLCSYFMKTILFWTIEETGCFVWIPNNLVKCFRACILKLSYFLKQKYLPNYFIPENNMIECTLSEDSLSNLCTLLDLVNNEGVGFTRRTDTLQDFLPTVHRIIKYEADETIALCRLLKFDPHLYVNDFNVRVKEIFFLNIFKTKLIRYLFIFRLLRGMASVPLEEKYDLNRRNKNLYCNYKSSLGYSVIGAKLCLSSWLSVAIIFYCHKNYNDTLQITDFIQSEHLLMKNFPDNYENTFEERFSIWQKLKLRCCKSFIETMVFYITETIIGNADLFFTSSVLDVSFACFSKYFMTYLRFMCFHHLKNISKKTNAVFELFEFFEEEKAIDFSNRGPFERISNIYLYLLAFKACYMSHIRIPDNLLNILHKNILSYFSSFNVTPDDLNFLDMNFSFCTKQTRRWLFQDH